MLGIKAFLRKQPNIAKEHRTFKLDFAYEIRYDISPRGTTKIILVPRTGSQIKGKEML